VDEDDRPAVGPARDRRRTAVAGRPSQERSSARLARGRALPPARLHVSATNRRLFYPYYRLQEAGIEVDVSTLGGEPGIDEYGHEFEADFAVDEHDAETGIEVASDRAIPIAFRFSRVTSRR